MIRAAIEPLPLDDRGSFAWLADAGDPMSRCSCALAVGDGYVIVDPVDTPGLDAALAGLGRPLGVVTLLDRHQRDAAALASRLGARRLTPVALGGPGVGLAGVEERTVARWPVWHEALLWLADRRLLVCAETLATADPYLARSGDRLGIHPLARPFPPRRAFRGLDPGVIVVGHGPPVREDAAASLRRALRHARRDLPRHWARLPRAVVRASRSARLARR